MIDNLNIIDLISEKHITLRREVEDRWQNSREEEINHTEAMLLAKINMGKISLAEVARQANISRQAMHKCAKKLEDRGYIEFIVADKGQTYAALTEKGVLYCEKSNALKEKIEREIITLLGEENVQLIKELLKSKWIK